MESSVSDSIALPGPHESIDSALQDPDPDPY
jgi:hypothetical protein